VSARGELLALALFPTLQWTTAISALQRRLRWNKATRRHHLPPTLRIFRSECAFRIRLLPLTMHLMMLLLRLPQLVGWDHMRALL
jgi:hypothetical protein